MTIKQTTYAIELAAPSKSLALSNNPNRTSVIIQNKQNADTLIYLGDNSTGIYIKPNGTYEINLTNPYYGEVWVWGPCTVNEVSTYAY